MRRSPPQARVNLSRRPFVNRRPIGRLAVLLWLLGIGLLVVNVKLYAGHWRGKAMYKQRLAEVNRELKVQRQELGVLDQELRRVNLRRQNRKTAFLNSLISHRTFPWSALFDDLEEVLPRKVRLLSVKPSVKLAAEPKPPRRQRRRTRPSAASAAADSTADSGTEPASEQDQAPLKRDEVSLRLAAVAESEDAMYELINRLYASSSFRKPFIPGEVRNLDSGSTSFSISVIYLTRPELPLETSLALAEDTDDSEPPDEIVVVSPQGEAAPEEADEAASPAPPRSEVPEVAAVERDRPSGGAGTAASESGRSPVAGRPGASSAETPATGRPTRGRPAAGPPASGGPTAGRPIPGGTAAGRPASGGPTAGRPAEASSRPPGTPRPEREGAPGSGAPRPGAPRPPGEEPPEDDAPPFADPPASATPRVRNGSMLAEPFDPRLPWRFGFRFLEVAA